MGPKAKHLRGFASSPVTREGSEVYNFFPDSVLTGQGRDMRTAVYALAGLAAASGVSAFMPQASFTGRAPSLRAGRSRPAVSVGEFLRPAPPSLQGVSAQQRRKQHAHGWTERTACRPRAGTPIKRRRGATGGAPAVAALFPSRHPRRTSAHVRVRTHRLTAQLFSSSGQGERGAGSPALSGAPSLTLGASLCLARSSLLSLLCALRPRL
jgi:hypothetical protein